MFVWQAFVYDAESEIGDFYHGKKLTMSLLEILWFQARFTLTESLKMLRKCVGEST